MSDNRHVATAERGGGDLTIPQKIDHLGRIIEKRKDQFATLIGKHGSYDGFKQVVIMAVTKTPDLLLCDVKSMIDSCLACASDGLVPDGRRAALVSFNDRERGKVCTYMPMIRGILEVLHRTGYVKDVQVDVVYRGEHFINTQGTDARLEHEPNLELRGDDGDIIGAYAVITTVNGGVYKRAMGIKQINKVMNVAKTKNVWNNWKAEMCQKTVLRNLSKLLPFDLDVFRRDDVMYDLERPAESPIKTVSLTHDPRDEVAHEPETPQEPQEPRQEPERTAKASEPEKRPETRPEPRQQQQERHREPEVRDMGQYDISEADKRGAIEPEPAPKPETQPRAMTYPERVKDKVLSMRSWSEFETFIAAEMRTDEWYTLQDLGADAEVLRFCMNQTWAKDETIDHGSVIWSRIMRDMG